MLDLSAGADEPVDLSDNIVELAAEVVAAFVSHNTVSPANLPKLIADVHSALTRLNVPQEPETEKAAPAVSARKSVSPDELICITCGKPFKSLKRHLRTAHDMTPDEYRKTWDLKPDYPMVAPNYSVTRSKLAKANELGKKSSAKKAKKARPRA